MARLALDIRLLGDKELSRKLKRFPDKVQTKLVRAELRKSAKRAGGRITQAVSGNPVGVGTGALLTGFSGARVRTRLNRRKALVIAGVPFPTREELGIDPKDRWFYPAALEYGTKERKGRGQVAEIRFMRDAVDKFRQLEVSAIRAGLARSIAREWKKRTGR